MAERIICLIREKEVNATKEEKVRQSFLGYLLYSLNYPKENIAVEVPIYDGRNEVLDIETHSKKRADIVIYENEKHEDIKAIIEVKKEKETTGENQVKSYGSVTNARYLVWHNGYNPTKIWKRTTFKNSWEWGIIPVLPHYGFEEGDIIPKKENLVEIENVRGLFSSINNFIWVNSNIKNKKEIFLQFLYILFIKLYDEYFNDKPNFYILESEYKQIIETSKSKNFENRFSRLFSELTDSTDFKDIFDDTDKLNLEPRLLAEIVYRLQYLKIRGSDNTGDAFQLFISPYYRGENDQYLTPEPAIKMILDVVNPSLKDVILDPACGTGRFLTYTITYLSNSLQRQNMDIKNWASSHVFGIDIDRSLVKISKIYMVLIGDGHTNIRRDNSLSKNVKEYDVSKFPVSIVITNPPFGSREKVVDKSILQNYELGYVWDDLLTRTDEIRKNGQTQGVLMLERGHQFLKENGIIGIVLPDGIFSNLADKYIRKWIVDNFEILAVISLPEETFRVETIGVSVKTSVLVARKKKGIKEHNIFFGIPSTIGYNQQGDKLNSNEVMDVVKFYRGISKEINGKYIKIKLSNDELINRMDAKFHAYFAGAKNTTIIKKLCGVFIGSTPGKSDYLDKGDIKILKVRCLTNRIIDWSDKKRDYVTLSWYNKRKQENLDINKKDIVLASAAHVAKYIGDEIDIVDDIPTKYSKVIASAKIFVIRVHNSSKINPYVLLLYLRTEEGYKQIQSLIRGQTAEIYPQDIELFRVPNYLMSLSKKSGKEIEKTYQIAIKKLREGETAIEEIHNIYNLKKHSNILHAENIEDEQS